MEQEYANLSEIAEKYDTMYRQLIYPTRPVRPSEWLYKNKEEFARDFETYQRASASFRSLLDTYKKESAHINEMFKKECLLFLGLLHHPKANKLWSVCWEYGHSSGYQEVVHFLDDLYEFLT